MKVLESKSYPVVKTITINHNGKDYKISFNQLQLVEVEGKQMYNATLHYKPRNGTKLFLHTYTDLKTSFKLHLNVVTKGKLVESIKDLKQIGKTIKSFTKQPA